MKKIFLIALLLAGAGTKAQYFQHVYGTANTDELSSGVNTFVVNNGHFMAGTTISSCFGGVRSIPAASTFLNGGANFENEYVLVRNGFLDAYDPQVFEFTNPSACGTGSYGIVGRYVDNNTSSGNTGVYYMQVGPGGAPGPVFDFTPTPAGTYTVTEVGGVARSLLFGGDWYVTGTVVDVGGVAYPFAIRFNECSGNMVWSQIYNILPPASSAWGHDIEENPMMPFGFASAAIVGEVINAGSPDAYIFHIDATNGLPAPHPVIIYGTPGSSEHFNSINQAVAGPFPPGFVLGGGTDAPAGNMDFLVVRMDMLIAPQFINTFDYNGFLPPGSFNDCYDVIQRVNLAGAAEYYATGHTAVGSFGGADIMVLKLNAAGAGVANGEFTFGGAGNEFSRSADQRNVAGGAPPAGLSIFGTWGSAPNLGGTDMYHIKSYFNGRSGCNNAFRPVLAPNTIPHGPQMPVVNTDQFNAATLAVGAIPIVDLTLCFNATIAGGNNARVAPDEDDKDDAMLIAPNPTETGTRAVIVEVEYENPADVDVSIYDMLGKQYYNSKFSLVKGKNRLTLDISAASMAPGIYNITIMNGENRQNKMLLIK